MKLIPHSLTAYQNSWSIMSLWQIGTALAARIETVLYPFNVQIDKRCASTHFEENQLALSSIGISPLSSAHPMIFQHHTVRTFTEFYLGCILSKDRSLRFGSRRKDIALFRHAFALAPRELSFNQASPSKSPALSSTSTQSILKESPTYCKLMVS